MITFDKLSESINREFGPPFLKKGIVVAAAGTDSKGSPLLSLRIGRRYIEINSTGIVVGSGTTMQRSGTVDEG